MVQKSLVLKYGAGLDYIVSITRCCVVEGIDSLLLTRLRKAGDATGQQSLRSVNASNISKE